MSLLNLAWKSILNRKLTTLLSVLSIALSTFLLLAIENDNVEAVKILTDAGTYPYVSDIDMPIRNRNYEMVKILSKFNRSDITPLITAMEIGDVKIMELLLENNRGRWPNAANVARKKGDIPMYNLLLKHGFICSEKQKQLDYYGTAFLAVFVIVIFIILA